MERRLAISYSVSATMTIGVACLAIAAVGGGLFASASPKPAAGLRREMVDDYIVVRSSTTTTAAGAIELIALDTVPPAPLPPGSAAPDSTIASLPARVPAIAQARAQAASTARAAELVAAPEAPQPEPAAPAPDASLSLAPITTPAPTTTMPAAPPRSVEPDDDRTSLVPPASQPIPPIPAGCQQPVLEDNGVWNCQ